MKVWKRRGRAELGESEAGPDPLCEEPALFFVGLDDWCVCA